MFEFGDDSQIGADTGRKCDALEPSDGERVNTAERLGAWATGRPEAGAARRGPEITQDDRATNGDDRT